MKITAWREKSEGEREKSLLELRERVRTLRFELATRETKKHADYRSAKRDIARLLTLEREGSLAA